MKINEIFYSIQGSPASPASCIFIRLTACDLRCTYCDTEYAFYEGVEKSVPEIVKAIRIYPTRLVLITGGEPMLQPSVHDLFRELLQLGYTVCCGNGRTSSLKDVDPRVHKIMDLSAPEAAWKTTTMI